MHGLTIVRWAEVGNEPNAAQSSLDEFNTLTRRSTMSCRARPARPHPPDGRRRHRDRENPARNHYAWMQWVAANMNDVVDAYAEHVYWWYDDAGRLEYRLRDTWHLMTRCSRQSSGSPVYMMEFGIRGYNAAPASRRSSRTISTTATPTARTSGGRTSPASSSSGSTSPRRIRGRRCGQVGCVLGPVRQQQRTTSSTGRSGLRPRARRSRRPTTRCRCSSTRRFPVADPARRTVGRQRLGRAGWRRGPLEQRHTREGTRRVRGAERRAQRPRARHERPEPQRPIGRRAARVQHRRPAAEHDVHARALERDGGRRRTRSPARCRRMPPGWRASRCRCTRRSRSRRSPSPSPNRGGAARRAPYSLASSSSFVTVFQFPRGADHAQPIRRRPSRAPSAGARRGAKL